MGLTKDEEFAYKGYEKVKKYFVPDSRLNDVFYQLFKLDRLNKVYDVKRMSRKEALADPKIFYSQVLRVHNILFYNVHKIFNHGFVMVRSIDPFKLPVHFFDGDDIFDGTTMEHFVLQENPPLITFKSIELSNPYTEHTPISYAHELMHTQIDSLRGCVTNYYDAEVLSVFIELVFAYYSSKDERLLNLEDSRRVQEILLMYTILQKFAEKGWLPSNYRISTSGEFQNKDNQRVFIGASPLSQRDEILEDTKYFVSDLKAYNLFITFYNGSDKIRQEMLANLQKVMDAELTLNEYLAKYDVTLESSQDGKRLIKYFDR